MRRLLLLMAAAALAGGSQFRSPDAQPGPGVPLALARERAARIQDLRYDLRFSIPARVSAPVTGRAVITLTLADATRDLALDFEPAGGVRRASVGGKTVALAHDADHLTVPAALLVPGTNEIAIEFESGEGPLNRSADFMYTLFVPGRAHLAFPCFDQPDLKAQWTLGLDFPTAWEAVANGAEIERTDEGDRRRVRFATTEPLPTYLFAFAAGRFSIETAVRDRRTFRILHRETDAAKVKRNRDSIFDLHASALAWLQRYTGIAYPWDKFDFVLIPSFQFGGMEHAGAIFYNASALLLDPSATQNQQLGRASLIAHETAHMWFGDLVTMRWFDDVWMKEVFANFMAAKIVNPAFPAINHDLRFLYAHYPAAYDVDRTPGTNAIRQPLDNLNDAGSLYGAIIYQKAPIVMRQLEAIVGADTLRDGLREYLKAFAFGNATWPDLIALLDRRTPDDLAAWSDAWVREAGRPIVETELRLGDGRIESLAFSQRDPNAGRGLTWDQRLQVVVGLPGGDVHTLPVRLRGARVEVDAARGLPAPAFVLPTGGGIGYGGFVLDRGTIDHLLRSLPGIDDPLTRGAAWVTLWEQMLDGRADPAHVIDLALRALPRERDQQNVERILGYTRAVFWRFLEPGARASLASRLEPALREGLDHAEGSSRKAAWFAALRDTALTRESLAWLERVWAKDVEVAGLTLAEPDFMTLALELAVRDVPGWREILDAQLARIQNPDRRARFEFVRPALSPDVQVRDALFERLKDVRNRRREPWVLEALSYLHHPLRAHASAKYVLVSLEMLPEIQRTGDIFFPRRWTDATLAGHRSTSVGQTVAGFLEALPADYPDRLRKIVLASSDELFRATRAAR